MKANTHWRSAALSRQSGMAIAKWSARAILRHWVRVDVIGQDGRQRSLTLTRTRVSDKRCALPWRPQRSVEMTWLRPDVAYLNLSGVTPERMDALAPELARAKYVIVDDRGPAQQAAWNLAAHLTAAPRLRVARFLTPLLPGREQGSGEYRDSNATMSRYQEIAGGAAPLTRAKLIVLIDENTASQAEHAVLMLQAATDATTIGAPTRGALGDLTGVALPGNLAVRFSGQAVEDLAGHHILGVGITPDIAVKPSLVHVIERRDPVLEAALAFIDRGPDLSSSNRELQAFHQLALGGLLQL